MRLRGPWTGNTRCTEHPPRKRVRVPLPRSSRGSCSGSVANKAADLVQIDAPIRAQRVAAKDELATGFRRLDQQRHGALVAVVVPDPLLALPQRDDVERLELVCEAMELRLALHRRDECGERVPFIELPQRTIGTELIVGELQRGRRPELMPGMVRGPGRIVLELEQEVAGVLLVVRLRHQRVRLRGQLGHPVRGHESREIACASLLELPAPARNEVASACARQFMNRVAIEVDEDRDLWERTVHWHGPRNWWRTCSMAQYVSRRTATCRAVGLR